MPMRRISSAHHSAQRFTSAACSGRALMLGMASSAFSSSRYLSRLTLMKSITLFMRLAPGVRLQLLVPILRPIARVLVQKRQRVERAHPIEKQHAVEVIVLVLDDAR